MAYQPSLDQFFHWPGDLTVVHERLPVDSPYIPTNIPVGNTTDGEIVGAAWDPCRMRTINGNQTLGFIASNGSLKFNFWNTSGNLTPSFGETPDLTRGLVLIGGTRCDVDLALGAGSPNPNVPPGNALTVLLVIANAGQARAMNPVLTITPPPSLSDLTTSGCLEDPMGIPTCTLKIPTQRWTEANGYVPFNLTSLWRNRSATVTLIGTYNGNAGNVVATVTSSSNETQPIDSSTSYRLGDLLLRDSFE